MEKKIVKDILFLSQVSQPASQEDLYLARDLQDTLLANRETCVGLAANMIGVQKRVIIFNLGLVPVAVSYTHLVILQLMPLPWTRQEKSLTCFMV